MFALCPQLIFSYKKLKKEVEGRQKGGGGRKEGERKMRRKKQKKDWGFFFFAFFWSKWPKLLHCLTP